jgi:hypothetical protein
MWGSNDVGMIVARYTQGGQTMLRQQAIIQRNDQLFYVLDFTSPSGHTPDDKPDVEDPAERMAVDIFGRCSIRCSCSIRKPLLADEEERLYRTRTLLVNLPKRIRRNAFARAIFSGDAEWQGYRLDVCGRGTGGAAGGKWIFRGLAFGGDAARRIRRCRWLRKCSAR